MPGYADAAGTLHHEGHSPAVAAEAADVPLHPLHGRALVQGAVVARGAVGVLRHQLGQRHEAEPVVHGDDDVLAQLHVVEAIVEAVAEVPQKVVLAGR